MWNNLRDVLPTLAFVNDIQQCINTKSRKRNPSQSKKAGSDQDFLRNIIFWK